MMERLTEVENGIAMVKGCGSNCKYGFEHCRKDDCKTIDDVIDKLAEYEDLEEQGLLLRLPCKVGDTVYIIDKEYKDCCLEQCDSYDSEIHLKTYCERSCPYGFKGIGVLETVVMYIEIKHNAIYIFTEKGGYRDIDNIFFTKAEAEQKLKAGEKNEN